MLRKVALMVLAVVLLALPLLLRWFMLYEGRYESQPVARPDLIDIRASLPEMASFVDRFSPPTPGVIVVDVAHENRFELAELDVLRARLAARRQKVETAETSDDLVERLRYAQALVVISPGQPWTDREIERVQAFVEKRGRLLLVTDPTRFEVQWDEWGDYLGLQSDVVNMNDLAANFGLIYQSDYLYNTVENEGNFRNIKLTNFLEHEITNGLERVVFYAAHSIVSESLAMITSSGETRSSTSERAENLPVAVLAADGAVLALGDLTFMTEPHNAVYDNDRLIANVADFLAGGHREYELADFPHFLDSKVGLVHAGDPLLDSDLLASGSALQALFAEGGRELDVLEDEDQAVDTLFLGLYEEASEVEPYLAAAQVTLWITPTSAREDQMLPTVPEATAEPGAGLTETLTATLTPDLAVTAELSPTSRNRVEVGLLGEMVLKGTSLIVFQTDGERDILVVLADTEEGLDDAVSRLIEGDFEDCLFGETTTPPVVVGLCPTGEVVPGEGAGGWPDAERDTAPPSTTPALTTTEEVVDSEATITETNELAEPSQSAGDILVIAVDDGQGRYDGKTSAAEYVSILQSNYQVTVWSITEDGSPDVADLLDYDLTIMTAGDFEGAFGDEEADLLFYAVLEGLPVIVSGAYVEDTAEVSVQRDIKVGDASHPMARGFLPGDVIPFVPGPSGSGYEINILEETQEEDGTLVPFVRGPASEDEGSPAVYALDEQFTAMRLLVIGFPIYLLPEDARSKLVRNAVDWMLNP